MKTFQCSHLLRMVRATLIGGAALTGALSIAPAQASFFPQKMDQACMAEQAGFALNCTANDVRVSKVNNIKDLNGQPVVECALGEMVTFLADVTVETTATARYDYSVYLPEGSWSAQDPNPNNECSVLIGQTNGPGVDLEKKQDVCADISKAAGYNPIHVYKAEQITLFCRDDDNSGKAEFNYCMGWHNKDGKDCSETNPAAPGTPSKCRCDSFDINVFVKPNPPKISKTLTSTNTLAESGGEFNFTASFTNTNKSSLFVQNLYDMVDIDADGSYDTPIDLWGPVVSAGSSDGVYLTASTCKQPANGGEIAAGQSYSCNFTVTVVDRDLPDDQSPQFYNDVIKLNLWDKNKSPVGAPEMCPEVLQALPGDNCSDMLQVKITNLDPSITVKKTPTPAQVPESGGDVTYTVRVTNTAGAYDSPLLLESLVDDKFGDLNGKGTCSLNQAIAYQGYYECQFTEFISGQGAGEHQNLVTAKAYDDERDEASSSDSALVVISDIPSAITLEKTADPTEVLETGDNPSLLRDVNYTFLFSVKSSIEGQNTVDPVTFSSLVDDRFGELSANCMVDKKNGQAIAPVSLIGFVLNPGEYASCTIARQLQGTRDAAHTNVATIMGVDADGQGVDAKDDATVNFIPGVYPLRLDFATSLLVVVGITNTDVFNATLTSLKAGNLSVFAEDEDLVNGVKILNSGGTYEGQSYGSCMENTVLSYAVDPGLDDTHICAFVIEFSQGLTKTDAIDYANLIVAELVNAKADATTGDVEVKVATQE
ncbi:MAG: hypothetical protein ACRDA8_04885 [Shewanella sp.]